MFEIDGTYGASLAALLKMAETREEDRLLIQRVRQNGIRIEGIRITALDGSELTDPNLTHLVQRFVEDTYRTPRKPPLPLLIVRRDIEDLCSSLERQRRANEPAAPGVDIQGPTAAVTPPAPTACAVSKNPMDASGVPAATDEVAKVAKDTNLAADSIADSKASETESKPMVSEANPAVAEPTKITAEEKSPAAEPQPQAPAIRKPATWEDNEPTEPWVSESIAGHLGFSVEYRHNYFEEADASSGWHILAATRRGRMHAHGGTHREDAFHFLPEKDFTIVCVSDGAGAYVNSRVGSEVTSREVVSLLGDTLTSQREEFAGLDAKALGEKMQTAIGTAVEQTCNRLRLLADKSGTQPKDFRCTLVLGILWLASETPFLFFSQVGDGFMASQSKDGKAQRHGQSDSGAFSGEVNCFIPDAEAPQNAQHIVQIGAANADAFIFCSDGIEDPFYPIEKQAPAIFQQLREGVTESLPNFNQEKSGPVIGATDGGAQLEKWLAFEKKGENDDRTILILHRTTPAKGATVATRT